MKQPSMTKNLPYVLALIIFLAITFVYLSPLLEGKKLRQGDIVNHIGMSKELVDFRNQTGEEALWTNSMFSGMPAFQISTVYKGNLMNYIDNLFTLWLPHPARLIFLYFIGFFILLLVLKINPWLSIAGAIAFAFSSYFFIIIEAGHNSKAHAIGYMAPVIAGVLLTFRGRYLFGGVITALFLALELYTNHPQITYYLFFIVFIFGIVALFEKIKEKQLSTFFKATGVLLIAIIFAIGINFGSLWSTYEYGKYTIRGKSELTINKNNQTSGLDKDYATGWSYGKLETLTLLSPNFMGGSSTSALSHNSNTYKALEEHGVDKRTSNQLIKQLPLYWGAQPFTSGPVYVGAIICFLFVLGLFIVKGPYKWWLLIATVISILLAWGKNFMPLSSFFLDYFPAYNKFRTVSMILVIAELAMPLLGILALQKIVDKDYDKKELKKAITYSLSILGGVLMLFILFGGGFFDFTSISDAQYKSYGYPDWLIDAIRGDRARMMRMDMLRSLVFILLGLGVIWAFMLEKIKKEYVYVAFILLFLVDMWPVNKRYLNNDNFTSKQQVDKPFKPSEADLLILQDNDPNFRVLNLTTNTFNDASTSYFHKSIGGYHGAKLRRYQELIEYHIAKNNMSVLDMLNTKYIIFSNQKGEMQVQKNTNALGNAWFVNNYQVVQDANEEIAALTNFNPAQTAIVDKRFANCLSKYSAGKDTTGSIKLTVYKPNYLQYTSTSKKDELVIFSEIYYANGWEASIDKKPAPYFRADYVLRAMIVPAGQHTIEFSFKPTSYFFGEKISFFFSLLLILALITTLSMEARKSFIKNNYE